MWFLLLSKNQNHAKMKSHDAIPDIDTARAAPSRNASNHGNNVGISGLLAGNNTMNEVSLNLK